MLDAAKAAAPSGKEASASDYLFEQRQGGIAFLSVAAGVVHGLGLPLEARAPLHLMLAVMSVLFTLALRVPNRLLQRTVRIASVVDGGTITAREAYSASPHDTTRYSGTSTELTSSASAHIRRLAFRYPADRCSCPTGAWKQ